MEQSLELRHANVGARAEDGDSRQAVQCLQGSDQLFSRSCSRCAGLLVNEWTYDLNNGSEISADVLRCIQCGQRVDPVILRNRLWSQDDGQRIRRIQRTDSVNTTTTREAA